MKSQDQRLHVHLPKKLMEELKQITKAEGMTLRGFVEKAIRAHLAKIKKNNSLQN
jgi:metal-responsive CopG/Arc/MetJ family transcriptional regulator